MMNLQNELRGIAALFSRNELAPAKNQCESVIRAHPKSAEAFRWLALIENRAGDRESALAAISKALTLAPSDPENLNIQGVLLVALGRLDEALLSFDRACSVRPDFLPAIVNRGNALLDSKRAPEALECFSRAAELSPMSGELALHRGRALEALGRWEEALQSLTLATRLNPRLADAHLSRAELLRTNQRPQEALEAFDAVLSFDANNPLALQNSATLLHLLGRLELAAARYERLIKLLRRRPEFAEQLDYALGMAVSCRRTMCSWDGLAELEAELIERVRGGQAAIKPILSLMIIDDPDVQAACARRTWERQFGSPAPVRLTRSGAAKHERLRIGYLCGDFRNHPTAWLIAGLIERHDRSGFEIKAYSSGPDDGSPLRQRLMRAFDSFIDISSLSDDDASAAIARDEVDVLVDLNGITDWGRGGVIGRRPAPVMVHFLGYPGPMGTRAIDYVIADHTIIPRDRGSDYDCAIVRLPGSYQVNARVQRPREEMPTREAAGLPPDSFVFCGFCQPIKLWPGVFDSWMRILARVPGSVLWLLEDNIFVQGNLAREARVRGIDPGRLIFAPRVDQDEHLARHRHADLLLDTWPCGAHTTASDALWLNVPMVTIPGRTWASRVGASVLGAAGLPDLIVESGQAYEDLAVALATEPSRLTDVKQVLSANKATCSLFDTDRFRRNIEKAYSEMWRRFVSGAQPESFDVGNSGS